MQIEFKRVFQKIRNCKNFEEVRNFINDYMTQVDNVDYKLDLNGNQNAERDLKILRENLEKALYTKGIPRNEPFQNLSENKTVMERIGCTESCFWCGALCWGNRDHQDSNSTKIHHTSHQPWGLACSIIYSSKELIAAPCHKIGDDWNVCYRDKGPINWRVAKNNGFSDWKFEAHYIHHFDKLMCWLFEKLHVDLAKHKEDANPASYEKLREYECVGLDYHSIMSTLRAKI